MIFTLITYCGLIHIINAVAPIPKPNCLTGYMTDVQSWVKEDGTLAVPDIEIQNAIDVSAVATPITILQQRMMALKSNNEDFKYLGMARCNLIRVPMIFHLRDTDSKPLSDTLEYITLYGNRFSEINTASATFESAINATFAKVFQPGVHNFNLVGKHVSVQLNNWSLGFDGLKFPRLKELDLRACYIRTIESRAFSGMTSLEALYLSENEIYYISTEAFYGLSNLLHLDLSRNFVDRTLVIESTHMFKDLINLASLDLSYTKLPYGAVRIFEALGKKFQRLSLCETGISSLKANTFRNTSLKYLDVSGNNGILNQPHVLHGTEATLTVVYADKIGLKDIEAFQNFSMLKVLKLSHNKVGIVQNSIAITLKSLIVLDLDVNKITSWFKSMFSMIPQLYLLSLRDNNINIISQGMLTDLENIRYLALSGNHIVCNCHAKELYETAYRNEIKRKNKFFDDISGRGNHAAINYHTAFQEYNKKIQDRENISEVCVRNGLYCINETTAELKGKFLFFDYNEDKYHCLSFNEDAITSISRIRSCNQTQRTGYTFVQETGSSMLALIIVPCIFLPISVFFCVYRRNLKYFLITIRNSAMLSLINDKEVLQDNTIFHYDVFLSYCNDDRLWVLQNLLPQVENGCNVSVCLHERDFQVGLSILENIVSCMDRSRSIMLVISKKFLLSHWCQFEMHLAQHRLLETRREDLILVLLEEIPRRVRPNTLHYLMLTKTYIVWPKTVSEQAVFWKRLKKSLITTKNKQGENSSLA